MLEKSISELKGYKCNDFLTIQKQLLLESQYNSHFLVTRYTSSGEEKKKGRSQCCVMEY